MAEANFEDEEFRRRDFRTDPLAAGVYENCVFEFCEGAGANIQHSRFISCRFVSCNLSLALISGSAFRDVDFEGCKMLGLRFDQCSGFGLDARFTDCILDQCVFQGVSMPRLQFVRCSIAEADFESADLREASFSSCELRDSSFVGADLRKADLRSAGGYRIDPERTKLKGARFAMPGVLHLLDKYGIRIEA